MIPQGFEVSAESKSADNGNIIVPLSLMEHFPAAVLAEAAGVSIDRIVYLDPTGPVSVQGPRHNIV